MRAILILTPYILVPLIITLFFRRFNHSGKNLTYALTGIIIFFYPFGLFWFDDYLNPVPPGPRCGNPQTFFFFGSLIIFLPITLFIQYIFNEILMTNNTKR